MINVVPAQPYRLLACPRCEYSLAAHPPAGTCPECGRIYSADEFVLYGYGMGERKNARNARPDSTKSLIVSGIVVVIVLFIYGRSLSRLSFPFYLVIVGSSFAIQLWRRFTEEGQGVVQLRLTPNGFRQGARQSGPIPFERNDRAALRPWRRKLDARVQMLNAGRAEIMIKAKRPWWMPTREYLHADVALEAEHVHELRKRMDAWIAAAAE
jgi:hypothetical protein